MNTRNTVIGIALALVVVGFFLLPWRSWLNVSDLKPLTATSTALNLTLPNITFGSLPSLENTEAGIEAWTTFEAYLKAAKAHDLPTIKSLSYQLSDTCADEAKLEECYGLMDSVVFFMNEFKQKDFTQVAFDDKQIVMATDYIMLDGATDVIKTVIYFVRDNGQAKVLGIRFCVGEGDADGSKCVETSKDKRDSNGNGWWDDVEVFFKK